MLAYAGVYICINIFIHTYYNYYNHQLFFPAGNVTQRRSRGDHFYMARSVLFLLHACGNGDVLSLQPNDLITYDKPYATWNVAP